MDLLMVKSYINGGLILAVSSAPTSFLPVSLARKDGNPEVSGAGNSSLLKPEANIKIKKLLPNESSFSI